MFANEDTHWWFVARRRIVKKILDRYLGREAPANILELGCGTGGNLQMLSQYGTLCAMELDDRARHMANSRHVCPVVKGRLPDDIPFSQGFDLLCMLDVLEHIDDDLGALQSLRKLCNHNGLVVITVPAYGFLWSAHDVACHHKRRYTKSHLAELVTNAGYKVKYATYFNTLLFPVIAIIRLMNKLTGRNGGSDARLPPESLNRILTGIFSFERALLPTLSLPVGVSILLLAEKKER